MHALYDTISLIIQCSWLAGLFAHGLGCNILLLLLLQGAWVQPHSEMQSTDTPQKAWRVPIWQNIYQQCKQRDMMCTPDNQGISLRNPNWILIHQVIELGRDSSEVEVSQTATHAVLPDLLQRWGYWRHICPWCQKALWTQMRTINDVVKAPAAI